MILISVNLDSLSFEIIIPALNEALAIEKVLSSLPSLPHSLCPPKRGRVSNQIFVLSKEKFPPWSLS